jgi:O-antigen/teichoic acid export membrane protein
LPARPARDAALRTALVGLAAIVSGVGSYVLLIVVSRSTTELEYSEFAVFWSLTVTIGLGFYYPIEQETAREVSGRPVTAAGGMARFVLSVSGGVTVIAALAALLLFTPAGIDYIGSRGLVIALIASFVAYAVQFPLRGLLSGSQRTSSYSGIIAVEGVLRVVLPVVIALLGFHSPEAFAVVVAVAALVAVLPALLQRDRSWLVHAAPPASVFASRTVRLIVAAFSIQLLLNSGTLLAKAVAEGENPALAGQILACLSIARIPVFVYQVLQILYLPRVSAEWKRGDLAGARRTLTVALVAAASVGAVVVGGMALLGRWVTGLLFGADLALSLPGVLLVSSGVALFIVALVASDGTLATGGHSLVLRSWAVAAAFAVPAALVVDDVLLRVTAPLIVGASVALVQLLVGLSMRYRAEQARREGDTKP